LIFTTVKIDFYHRANSLIPPCKLIFPLWKIDYYYLGLGNWFFTTVEIDF